MTTYYARVDYTYTSGNGTFTIPFSYIKKEHVKVFINNVATTNFSFNTTSQITVSDTLTAGDVVSIRRSTKLDGRLVNFTNTSILNKDNQNTSAQQTFNLVQEMYDENAKFEADVDTTIAANKTELETTIASNKAELEAAQDAFETNINETIASNKAELEAAQDAFETNINETIAVVSEAAERINELEEAVDTATGAAQTAIERAGAAEASATLASEKATELTASAAQIEANRTGLVTEITNRTTADALLQNQVNDLKFISTKAYCEYLNFLKAGSTHTKLKILANTAIQFKLGTTDYSYKTDADVEFDVIEKLDEGTALQAGKDYSVYICPSEDSFDFVVSLNATYPTGYSATTAFKIGGFHTLCLAVTSANAPALATGSFWATHPAIGYATGDIIPNSVWCLTHRPIADPSGMAYDKRINKFVDIYLQSGTFSSSASVFGGTTTDTRQPILHQFDMLCVFKEMPTDNDFMSFAEGSNNLTAIAGAADAVTTGGHLDTAGKRMISGNFIEDCCGFLWQWLNEIAPVDGTGFESYGTGAEARGQSFGMPRVLPAGGSWLTSSSCGSWSRSCFDVRSSVNAGVGCRGVSRCLLNGKLA